MKDANRFVDPRLSTYAMMDEILAVCPRCSNCCRIFPINVPEERTGKPTVFDDRRVVCTQCGFTKDCKAGNVSGRREDDPMVESYFELPLWLQTPCCGYTLWAYNWRHLNLIGEYVAATLREQHKLPTGGWFNGTLLNKLPRWISAAKNRNDVLKAIEKLRAKEIAS